MSNELQCKSCGENVQKGLVRCWSCGSFMREDIQKSFLEKKSARPTVILSEPDIEDESDTYAIGTTQDSSEDDFELKRVVKSEGTVVDHTLNTKTPVAPIETISLEEKESSISTPEESTSEKKAPEKESKPEKDQKNNDKSKPKKETDDTDNVHHSIETGGDELLAAALEEEKQAGKKKEESGKPKPKTRMGIIVYCPNGHPIEVQERHRGKAGKCPKCKESFNVPAAPLMPKKETSKETENQTKDGEATETAKEFLWMEDVHFHEIDLQKLSLKLGSLEKLFKPIDLRVSQAGLLFLTLTKGAGLFGSAAKKHPEIREAAKEQLSKNVPVDSCGVADHFQIDSPEELTIVQPAAEGQESLFAGIPIFGEARIALNVPRPESGTTRFYISFSLSEFRKLSQFFGSHCEIEEFGKEHSIPLEDLTMEKTCHYTEAKFEALENIEWYQNDAGFELEISGRQCKECGLEISEDGRKKENIGGKTGKGIAKAKCPKCEKKFGDMTLYSVKTKE